MEPANHIPFIRRGGEQIYRQPFDALGVQFYGFVLEADEQVMQQQLCDRYLNQPSQGKFDFAPFGSWCLLVFNNLAKLASTELPDSEKGQFTERESAIWVLLQERNSGKLYWFLPYIFVNNSYALCMGRETYGFPKSLGIFEAPYFPEYATYFDLKTEVIPTYTPNTQGTWQTLWSVTQRVDQGSKDNFKLRLNLVSEGKEFIGEVASELRRHSLGSHKYKLLELTKNILELEVPMVFLKQFPAIENPNDACYQAIATTNIKMTGFNEACLLPGEYQIHIRDYDSHPVRSNFGFSSEKMCSVLSFYANIDFLIGNGQTLWQANIDTQESCDEAEDRHSWRGLGRRLYGLISNRS